MLIQALYRQSLIAQKNNLQYNLLRNWSNQRAMLNCGFMPSFGNSIELENINNSIQLMAVNAELSALNNYKMDYLA